MKHNRVIGLLLCACMSAGCASGMSVQAASTHPDLLAGDADGNGTVNIDDATAVQKYLAGEQNLDELYAQVAKTDFTNDQLTINDATLIQQYAAGKTDDPVREVGQVAFVWRSRVYKSAASENQRQLNKQMELNAVGGAALVTRNGRVLCQSVAGMQNTPEGKEISIDTLFPVGSISKQFCAAAVLQLQEQGKLSLDDKVTKYFPRFTVAKNVTLRNMLSMRSGIRDYANYDAYYVGNEYPEIAVDTDKTEAENQQTILSWLYTQKLKFDPGSAYSYSNSNYMLASLIVEKITGMSYNDYLKQYVLEPLHLTRTGFYEEMRDDPMLCEWIKTSEYELSAADTKGIMQGAGDLASCAGDIDKWLTSLRKRTLLSRDSYNQMFTDYGTGYGLGVTVGNSGKLIGHSGAVDSYSSHVLTQLDKNVNIFIVTNDYWGLHNQGRQIDTVAYKIKDFII